MKCGSEERILNALRRCAHFNIGDGIHNLESGEYVKILMTAPHNRGYDAESNGMIRVNNRKEAESVTAGLYCREKGKREKS